MASDRIDESSINPEAAPPCICPGQVLDCIAHNAAPDAHHHAIDGHCCNPDEDGADNLAARLAAAEGALAKVRERIDTLARLHPSLAWVVRDLRVALGPETTP